MQWSGGIGGTGKPGVLIETPAAKHHEWLTDYANEVHPKKTGEVLAYAMTNGRSRDEDTEATTAFTLDCDGAGDWTQCIRVIEGAGLACFLQRSGGHTPG